ncbi:MAG: immune inhibitor A, partial [Candidatus Zixiibacteriota bacterium]
MKTIFPRLCLRVFIFLVLNGYALSAQTITFDNSSSGLTLLNQDRDGLTLSLNIGSIDLNTISITEGTFTVLTIDGFTRSQKIGEPNLPMINRLISIPFGCELRVDVVDREVEEINLDDYDITAPIIPVQPSLSKSQDPDDLEFEYKEQLYSRSGYYTLPLVSSSDVGVMRALRLGMVSIAPIEYNPTENILRIYKSMTISVEFLRPDWETTSDMRTGYYSPFFEVVYSQIINYEPLPPTILADLVTYPVKYLIIADRMFESQLQPFVEWKTKKGFNVIVAYTDVIGYSNPAIRSYIQSVYNNSNPPADPRPSFVLLVGDDQQIPAFSHGSHISDLDFCEFTGDHNPEIYYGRFSAQNTSLLQPQIDKTLEYEQYTMPDPGFLGDVTMIAGVDATYAPTHGNGQINYGVNLYFNSQHGIYSNTWLYPQSGQPGAAAAIIQTVNDGVGFINYTAHGSHSGWGNPAFSSSDVNNLTNAHKYPLAVGNCCLTNTFGDNYSTPCVGEVWLQAANKGAIGYIGGSNSTYWDEDYWWGVGYGPVIGNGPSYDQTGLGVYDGVFHDHGEPLSDHYVVNDALIFCGNLAVQESGSSLTNYYWEIYHLMGDPSVMTYLGIPAVNNVQHSPVIILADDSFTVQADEASYVGLSKNGVLHGAAYIGQSGMVNMDITPFTVPGTADLVVTGQNKQPYITTVQVIAPSGPYVVYDSCDVNDPTGNNNGLIDFGESILLDMQMKNVGPDTAYGVEVVLSSADQYVTITDSFEVFGDIVGDFGTVNIDNAFSFDVSVGIPDQHAIPLHLQITGTNMDTLSSDFSLIAHAPDLNFMAYAINDETGNNNGILDAGETAELIVSLANDGSGDAASVAGILSESDDFVTISDPNGSFGDIDAGANGQNTLDVFVVTADSLFPQGHNVLFDLELSAAGGYTAEMQFILTTAESFEYSNGGYTGSGSWQWGEPTYGPPGAHFGVNVWGVNLSGDYPNGCNDNLISTSFFVHSPDAVLEFYHWYDIEDGWDGGNVSVSTNGGSSWELIDPSGGYPDQSINALGEPGYTNTSNGWIQAQFSLSDYINRTVIFRWRFASDGTVTAPGWYIDDVAVTNNIPQPPPDIACDPTVYDVSVEPGSTATRTLEIFNNGSGPLYYSLNSSVDNPLIIASKGSSFVAEKERYIAPTDFRSILEKTGSSEEPLYPPVILGQGGPDLFGHTWIDSDEPGGPSVSWVDISSVGTEVFPGEDSYVSAPIGFSFPFYENSYSTLYICSNGMLTFGSGSGDYGNDPIPHSNTPHNFIAPWWDDLSPQDGHVYYYQDTANNR